MPFYARYKHIPCHLRPSCPHGPTILFERISDEKQFFACAAFRDRKGCPFYLLKADFEKNPRSGTRPTNNENQAHVSSNRRLKQILQCEVNDRRYCKDCSLLFLKDEQANHKEHNVMERVPDSCILRPITSLLSQKSSNKHEAQYAFSSESKEFILSSLSRNHLNKVICIGTPVIHESIQSQDNVSTGRDSILLDIDHRIAQFYPRSKFIWFNMFNQFFMDGRRGEKNLSNFIASSRGDEIVLIVDPPFGAFVELLAEALNFLTSKICAFHDMSDIPVILCLPFFLSPFVNKTMPHLKMSDYIVQYTNHNRYKKKSPVRIFTNLQLDSFNL